MYSSWNDCKKTEGRSWQRRRNGKSPTQNCRCSGSSIYSTKESTLICGEIFDRLNERFFRGRLRGYKVLWGRKQKRRPKEYFIFGTIQEEDRVIRINPLLDQPFVPPWFLRYILYHEMLHAVVPDEIAPNGRRRVHTELFYEREREFPGYRRARRWEEENLARFLR